MLVANRQPTDPTEELTPPDDLTPFGAWVLGVLRKHGTTYRGQRKRTAIPHSTVMGWVQGIPPRPDGVIQFAEGMGEDPDEGMIAAGYLRVKNLRPTPDSAAEALLETAEKNPQELTYEPDLEGVHVEGFSGTTSLSPNDQEIVNRIVRHLIGQRRKHLGYHTEGVDDE